MLEQARRLPAKGILETGLTRISDPAEQNKVMTVQRSKSHPQKNNRNGWQPIPIPFPYSFAGSKNSHTSCQPLMKG